MMSAELQKASVYTDVQGLAALRRQAGGQSPEALEKVARQFESMFLQMMLKSMRDAGTEEGGLFDSDQTRLYQDMYDKQLSLSMSESGNGIGLAKMLVQQLQTRVPGHPGEGGELQAGAMTPPQRGSQAFALQSTTEPAAVAATQAQEPDSFDSPEVFVHALWPHARAAGEKLGVEPRAILAQAALETGWGKAVIRHADGRNSHNLFNIKADHRWDGESVGKLTLEYRDGVAAREQASFRSYGSWAESFEDYAAFLQENPRYTRALEAGGDAQRFAEHLQEAGYATDPAYASKIKRIINNELMAGVDSGLKLSAEGTLTS